MNKIARACALAAGLMLGGCEGMEGMEGFDGADMVNMMNTMQNMENASNGDDQAFLNALEQSDPDMAPFLQTLRQGMGNNGMGGGGNSMGGGNQMAMGNSSGPMPGAVTPGSYAARKNLAIGPQCPGFTMGNYRDRALNGGNNKQLFALCGEAFEYYKWYQNAIAQGYSKADSDLTYNAHAKTVQAINQFVRETQ